MTEEPKKESPLDEAKQLHAKLEDINTKLEVNLDRMEKLKAFEMIGGQAEAGTTPPEPKEESPQEYAARVRKGEL